MRKASFQTIYTALTNYGFENAEIMTELANEINKGADAKAQNAAVYDEVKPLIFGVLCDTPLSISEIYEAVADDLPNGFTKGKVQYAVTRLWANEVCKHDGKTTTYTRKG